ncbi:DUF1844 domain-containing protein [Nitratidesulfovibrio sp. SRB-5]|uniref:DUF1844 domain-containing protein n=1 Tax=Nitratidesulfovibrio sp. SRB-5 TaxID=2872636 RepID=UPI001025D6B2|nr:DUF1844 domain-containing protein [Nitratidesulfovibrio sp. SRB-5]MBZ2172123.1 DUF1844 domain-containing protein [Nitratidesulfovibrio sp. SRB-5]RXF75757.1 DUF1844 domain-containing protein [Desulfovibrio sp. DS-1]
MTDNERTGCGCAAGGAKDGGKGGAQDGAPHGAAQMPQVTFSTFILSLASSALVQLGEVPDPDTGRTSENLLMAKHTIDVLTMLQEKTRGCADADEARLLEGVLYELRMKYVVHRK